MDPPDFETDVEEVVREDVFPLAEDEDEMLLDNLPATLNFASAAAAAATRKTISSRPSRFISTYDAKPAKLSIDKARRMKTNPHIQESDIRTAPDTFAVNAFKSIVRNLDQKHINTNRLVQRHFSWMLPGPSTTSDQLKIFYALQNYPMVVPTADLAKILKLERSTMASLPTAPGQHFYSRAWEFTAQQLTAVVQLMVKNDIYFDECTAWMEAVSIHNTPRHPCTFTIRYIGTVKGPGRPIDRYMEDLRNVKSGVLGDFLNAVEQLFPELQQQFRFVAEDTERVLIELFHHRTLLNRQLGGYFSTFVPGAMEVTIFESLRTCFYAGFYKKALSATTQIPVKSALLDHFDAVQLWANDNPGLTGTGAHIFNDDLKNALRKQATPMFYQGTAIMVLLGEAVTLESYVDTTSFLGGNSRSGRLTVDMLSRLASTEAHNVGQSWEVRDFEHNHIPFVDLWQWLWRRNEALPQVLSFASQYLSIVRPLIVLTLGRSVASVVKSNLLHNKGLSYLTTMTSVAGELSIQYYQDPDDTNTTENENNAFIAIPHFHPGYDRYSGQAVSQPLLRVIDLTWQLSLHVADIARKYLDEEPESGISRKKQCGQILQRVEQQRASDPAMRAFMDNFRRAKDALLKALLRTRRPAERIWSNNSPDYQPLMNEQGRELIASLGQGEGEPGSDERKDQLERLWTQNIPDLHLSISHSPKNKTQWINEFITLQRGQYFFLQVIADYAEDDYVAALLERFRPEWAEDDSWLHDLEGRKKAFLDCGLWIHRRHPNKTVSNPRRQGHPARVSELPGLNIGINAHAESTIRWVREDDTITSVVLYCPAVTIPQRPQDVRALAFTEYGIDIVDVSGQPFRYAPVGRQLPPATLPSTAFARVRYGGEVYDMWAAVRRYQGHFVPPRISASDDVWEGEKGMPALPANRNSQSVEKQNRPPKMLDANWLLNKFLDERFPTGGVFRTAPKSRRPDSTEDLQAFLDFLKSPAYHGHPYAEFWISCFPGGEMVTFAPLSQNIELYRRLRSEQSSTSGPKGTETIYHIGPPGTSGRAESLKVDKPSSTGAIPHIGTFYHTGEPGASDRAEDEALVSDDEDAGLDGRPWGDKQGVSPVTNVANDAAEIPKQNRPPNRLDGSWLLWTFLQERFPNGGTWMSTPLSINPNSTHELDDFLEFLRRPEYLGHPWSDFWVTNMRYTTDKSYGNRINVVIANTLPYRSCVKQSSKIGKLRQTLLIIGAPGTAAPFDEKAVNKEMRKKVSKTNRRSKAKKAEAEANAEAEADEDHTMGTSKRKKSEKRDTDDGHDQNEEGNEESDQKKKKRKRGSMADSGEQLEEALQEIPEPSRKKAKTRSSRRK